MKRQPVSGLTCEYLVNPLGMDTDRPRFSWKISDPRREAHQTAYRILVASTRDFLERYQADLWDSGRVESDETLHVEYAGKPLDSGGFYFWKVQAWTMSPHEEDSATAWSEQAYFSVGLLRSDDWKAKWIATPESIPDSPMHVGYMSLPVMEADSNKWVQIDLGARKTMDGVRLNPAWGRRVGGNPFGGELAPGNGFPQRFKIEVSDHETMNPSVIVADHAAQDVANPGKESMTIRFDAAQGRYVRLTSFVKITGVLKLAGLEILHGETDLAKGCKATAFDSTEMVSAGFGVSLLTAGKTGYDGGQRKRLKPSALFRGEFGCEKTVCRAIAYATALGNYELHFNGTRIDSCLSPGYTDYDKRVPVQAYDVTALLRSGINVAGAVLADGWYRSRYRLDGHDQFKDFAQGRFGDAIPRFLLQIQVDYEDGTREIVGTDETWRCSMDGPYRTTSIYDGVVYDAQCEIPSWDEPGFSDVGWKSSAVSVPTWSPYLWPQTVQPITCRGEFVAVSMEPTEWGTWICDFGQGVGGFCRVTLDGPAGTRVKLRHAMALNDDGSLYTGNLWGAKNNGDVYILAGKGPQTFMPDFTFHGFRFVEISGVSSEDQIVDIVALMIANHLPVASNFRSSDARLNKLWDVVGMTYQSCLKSALLDVVDRDERWGWMGDCGTVLTQSMSHHFDTASYFKRRCRDMMDGQWSDGHFPSQAPRMDHQRTCTWSDAVPVMAWTSWLNYGDQRLLSETYASIRKYFRLLASNYERRDTLWPDHNGDWLSAFMTVRPDAKSWQDLGEGHMSKDLMNKIDLLYVAKLVREIAVVLGETTDAAFASAIFEKLSADPVIDQLRQHAPYPGAQSAYAMLLGWEVASAGDVSVFVEKLLDAITAKGGHVTTGTITTHLLLKGLSDNGHHELAYRLAMKPEFPSYGFMIDRGATVLWEHIDAYIPGMGFNPSPMNGLNHIGFGAVSEWIFGFVGGIRPDPAARGYKSFWIAPRMGGGVTWANSDYDSIRGKIVCDWKLEKPIFSMKVVIPPNTTATVFVPAAENAVVTEGGLPAENAAGVKFLRKEPGAAVYVVGSGTFKFNSAPHP